MSLTSAGRALREDIETATDEMEVRVVRALGDDAERLFELCDPWCAALVEAGSYPVRITWPT